ncbi:MAG: hypothetical protein ACKN9V_08750, partial [Pseudomonadota bacterium]
MLGLSMIDGKKYDVSPIDEISDNMFPVGLLFMGLLIAFGISLYRNYDVRLGTLNFFGRTLTLAEKSKEK